MDNNQNKRQLSGGTKADDCVQNPTYCAVVVVAVVISIAVVIIMCIAVG